MTTGSRTYSDFTLQPRYYNGAFNGNVPVGTLRTKTWSGGDAGLKTLRAPGTLRTYYVPDPRGPFPNGKPRPLVKKRFREKRVLKRSVRRAPQNYSMSSVLEKRSVTRQIQSQYNPDGTIVPGTTSYYDSPACSGPGPDMAYYAPGELLLTANDEIALVGKLREQLRGTDFDFAVFLAEGNQALGMITSAATRLAKAYRAARKGNFGLAATTLGSPTPRSTLRKNNANSWLELQYGWLPLLSDMKSGAEQLAHLLHVPFVSRYRVSISRRQVAGKLDNGTYGYANRWSTVRAQQIAYISEKESLPVLSGILDPELILWELTPFSFVADWALPIGDYLAARAFANRLTGTFVRTVHYHTYVGGWYGVDPHLPTRYMMWKGSSPDSRETHRMVRSVSSTLSVPMPNVKSLERVASWRHCANALALLTQAVR